MTLRIGSLFSGVGGLDLAVEAFFGAETAWHCEWEAEPSKVLAARWPGVPNFGDVTAVDWSTVEPVDILCGGFPCQDLSLAGRRSGMRPGTRSGLWSDFVRAIDELNPSVVVIENVRGLLSGCAESDSDVEPCPGCVAEERGIPHAPRLRALGRVLGDLDQLGFDAEWHGLPASDVGAPHGRFRVFVLAYARGFRHERSWPARNGRDGSSHGGLGAADRSSHLTLLPTPAAGGFNETESVEEWSARRARVKEATGNGNGFGMPLGVAVRLLPTVRASDGPDASSHGRSWSKTDRSLHTLIHTDELGGTIAWGEYEPAVRLWESLTRPAPAPTLPDGKNGNHRLSPLLPEWMMGYDAGWVTDIIARNPAIKACGNGVVPQQAFAALGILWGRALEWIGAADV